MFTKWIGAVIVLTSCYGFGLSMAHKFTQEERIFLDMHRILIYMKAELKFHLTALPELCRQAGNESNGITGVIFHNLANELVSWTYPDTSSCMRSAIKREKNLSPSARKIFLELGSILGRFDLDGQIRGLDMIISDCEEKIAQFRECKKDRIRNYKTLALCTGVALVILFI